MSGAGHHAIGMDQSDRKQAIGPAVNVMDRYARILDSRPVENGANAPSKKTGRNLPMHPRDELVDLLAAGTEKSRERGSPGLRDPENRRGKPPHRRPAQSQRGGNRRGRPATPQQEDRARPEPTRHLEREHSAQGCPADASRSERRDLLREACSVIGKRLAAPRIDPLRDREPGKARLLVPEKPLVRAETREEDEGRLLRHGGPVPRPTPARMAVSESLANRF